MPKSLAPKAIVFDWDDVFTLGSFEAYCACYRAAAEAVGVSVLDSELRDRVKSQWGRPHRDEVAAVLGDTLERLDEAARAYENAIFTDTFTDHLRFVEGGKALLDELAPSYRLAIATGIHPRLLTERVMPKFGVDPSRFEEIVTSYDLSDPARGKPCPDLLEIVLHRMGVAPEDALMVGDAPGDMKMAQAASVEPVAVLTGQLTREAAKALGVQHIIAAVTDLPNILVATELKVGSDQ